MPFYRNTMTEKPSVSAIEVIKLKASFPEGSKPPVGPNAGGPGKVGVPGAPVPAFL